MMTDCRKILNSFLFNMKNKKTIRTLASIALSIFVWHIPSSSAKEAVASIALSSIISQNSGTILFEDHFVQDGNLANAHHWPLVTGAWLVKKGVLSITNDSGPTTEAYILAGDNNWTDYCITGQVSPDNQSRVDNCAGILLRVNSDKPFGSRYTICLNPYKNWVGCANDRGPKQWIGHGKFHFATRTWYDFSASVHGNSLDFSLNGKPVLHCDHLLLTHGKIGLEAWNKGTQSFRNIEIKTIE
jgi:hypothetical protein